MKELTNKKYKFDANSVGNFKFNGEQFKIINTKSADCQLFSSPAGSLQGCKLFQAGETMV